MRARYVILIVLSALLVNNLVLGLLLRDHWSEHWDELRQGQQAAEANLKQEVQTQFQGLTASVERSIAERNADHKAWVRHTVSEYLELKKMVEDPPPPPPSEPQ